MKNRIISIGLFCLLLLVCLFLFNNTTKIGAETFSQYMIISGTNSGPQSLNNFQNEVTKYLRDGWKLRGDLLLEGISYYQVLVK
jgi:hypothetical protein